MKTSKKSLTQVLNKLILFQEDLFQDIVESINKKSPQIYSYFSFHCFNRFYENDLYADLLKNNIKIYAADTGIYFLLKLLGYKSYKRFSGSDFNKLVIHFLISSGKKFFLIGGNFNSLELSKLGSNLSGYFSGYFESEKESSLVKGIKDSDCSIIIIGMGIPKQEILAAKLMKEGAGTPVLCVGNFMKYYLGTQNRAPLIIRECGMEWIYRMVTERGRLWRRYLIGIPKFLFRGALIFFRSTILYRWIT